MSRISPERDLSYSSFLQANPQAPLEFIPLPIDRQTLVLGTARPHTRLPWKRTPALLTSSPGCSITFLYVTGLTCSFPLEVLHHTS